MGKLLFATNINKTNLNGIVDVESPRVLCYCNEGQSYVILEAFKALDKVKELEAEIERLKQQWDDEWMDR